jgi:hypothetical protein
LIICTACAASFRVFQHPSAFIHPSEVLFTQRFVTATSFLIQALYRLKPQRLPRTPLSGEINAYISSVRENRHD